jgi:PAS domain S-box-containing protein
MFGRIRQAWPRAMGPLASGRRPLLRNGIARAALGPLITLATIAAIVALRSEVPIPTPGIVLLLTVAVAAVLGGVGSALVSAALLSAFVIRDASLPGTLFSYSPDALSRLVMNVVAAAAMAVLVGAIATRSKRHEVEVAQARAGERDRALTESATDAIVTIDRDSRIRSANRATHELFGYADGSLVGRPLPELMPESMRGKHLQGIADYVRTGHRHIDWQAADLTGRHASGREFPVEVSFAEYGSGDERRFIGVIRDVGRRRNLEEQLRQAQKMEAVGQLAGGVAHDFNNILTAVYGFTDLVRTTLRTDDERHEQLGYVIDAATRGRDLVAQLLAFGRRQRLNVEVVNMDEVVVSVEPMLRRLIGEHIAVRIAVGAFTSPIKADSAQLGQVIVNLALNARDAMPNGGTLTIETATVDLDPGYAAEYTDVVPGRYTMLAVSDDGIGMDAATKARIFEPFFTTKALGQGTGLGLATVHGIVSQSGGRLIVYSEPDRGTTIRAYFPVTEDATASPGPVAPPVPRGASELLLVAEDDDSIRELARSSLERLGYRVVAASTPAEALDIAAAARIEAVITDIVMPGMSGIELAAAIRAKHGNLPVLFMSGYAEGVIQQQGDIAESDGYLPKPFTPDDLGRAIGKALGRTAATPPS